MLLGTLVVAPACSASADQASDLAPPSLGAADSLTDGEEINDFGTDPLDDNTDGDCYFDGTEADNDSDPLDPNDPIVGRDLLVCEVN